MTCHELHEFLMSYVEGELPPPQRAEFEKHLGLCKSCVNFVDSYKATPELARKALVSGDAKASVPDGLIKAILAARKSS